MTPEKIISILNVGGFTLSIYQGGGADHSLLWYGAIYNRERHLQYSRLSRSPSWEEKKRLPCYHYHLVTHRQPTYLAALEHLLEQYFNPPEPPRPRRPIGNPLFKSKARRAEPQLEDLL